MVRGWRWHGRGRCVVGCIAGYDRRPSLRSKDTRPSRLACAPRPNAQAPQILGSTTIDCISPQSIFLRSFLRV